MDIVYRFKTKTLPKVKDKINNEKLKSIGEVVGVNTKTGDVLVRHKDLKEEDFAQEPPAGEAPPMQEGPPPEQAPPAEGKPIEPYGAQVLRRIHQDTGALIADYEEMMTVLDNEGVKAHMTEKMKLLVKEISTIEKLFKKTYKELGPLTGGEEVTEETPDQMGEVQTKDADTMGDAAVGADSTPRQEPTPDEVVMGMVKCLCGEANCTCGKSLNGQTKSIENQGTKDLSLGAANPGKEEFEKQQVGEELSEPAHLANVSDDLADHWALKPAEQEKVREASSFLKEIADPLSMFEDEHRMKSYHYHKTLEPLGGINAGLGMKAAPRFQGGMRQDRQRQQASNNAAASGSKETQDTQKLTDRTQDQQNIPATQDQDKNMAGMEPDQDYMTKWVEGKKAIAEASLFFKDLAYEKAFGDPHRQMSLKHCSLLDGLVNNTSLDENADGASANELWDYASFVDGKKGMFDLPGEVDDSDFQARLEAVDGTDDPDGYVGNTFAGTYPLAEQGEGFQARPYTGTEYGAFAHEGGRPDLMDDPGKRPASADNSWRMERGTRDSLYYDPNYGKALNDLMKVSQAQELEIEKMTKTLNRFAQVF